MAKKEMVDHPDHYNKGIETIDYIESWSMDFSTGNVVKYVTRAKYKDKPLEDLKKAKWYLERLIENAENENGL
jgi:hypothetical protein